MLLFAEEFIMGKGWLFSARRFVLMDAGVGFSPLLLLLLIKQIISFYKHWSPYNMQAYLDRSLMT